MANEVVITYYTKPTNARAGSSQPLYNKQLGGQVLNIGTTSAIIPSYVGEFPVEVVRVKANGAGFWLKRGESDVSAAANTGGNDVLADGEIMDFEFDPVNNYFDTAA